MYRGCSLLAGAILLGGCGDQETSSPQSSQETIEQRPPIEMSGVFPLTTAVELDAWRRPRIELILGKAGGQRITAMFDTGASKSVMTLEGPMAYWDRTGLVNVANTDYKYMRFVNEKTLAVRKVVREEAEIVGGQNSSPLKLDFHLYVGDDYRASAQHLGAGPTSNFTGSVGGYFGYLPNDRTELDGSLRAWLVLGHKMFDSHTMCAIGSQGITWMPLVGYGTSNYWVVKGAVALSGGSPEQVHWIIDTGGSPSLSLPSSMYDALVREIQKDGRTTVTRRNPRDRFETISDCRDGNSRFPSIHLKIGLDTQVVPEWDRNGIPYYLGFVQSDGSCTMFVSVDSSDKVSISTDVIDLFYFAFNQKGKTLGICLKNADTIRQLSGTLTPDI